MVDPFDDQTNRGLDEAADLTREGGGKPQTLSRRQIAEQMSKLGIGADAPAESKGVLGNFAAGFSGSLRSQQAAGLQDLALVATSAGNEETALELSDKAALVRRRSEIANAGESSLEGVDSAGEFVDYLGYTLGQAAGFIGGTVATGLGVGKVAQIAARKVLRKTMEGRLEAIAKQRGLAKAAELSAAAARKAGNIGSTTGAIGASIAVNTGLIGGDIYDETGELRPGVSLAGGIVAGSLDSILPVVVLRKVGGQQAVDDVAWNILKDSPTINRYLTAATKGFGIEGGTEAAQEIVNMYSAAYARTNGLAEAAAAVADDPQLASRLLNNFVAGGIGGAAFGAGAEAMKVQPDEARAKMLERIRQDFDLTALEQRIHARTVEARKAQQQMDEAGATEGDYIPKPRGGLPEFEAALEASVPEPTRAPRTPVPADEQGTLAAGPAPRRAKAVPELPATVLVDSQGRALPVQNEADIALAGQALASMSDAEKAAAAAKVNEASRRALGIPKGVRPLVDATGRGIAVPQETSDLARKTKARWIVVGEDGMPMTVSPVTGRPLQNGVFRGKDHVKPLEVAKVHGGKLFDAETGLVLEEGEYKVPEPTGTAPAKVTVPKPPKKGGKGGPTTPVAPAQGGPVAPPAPATPAAAKSVDLGRTVATAVAAGKQAGIPVPNPSAAIPAAQRAERVITALQNMDLKGDKAVARDAIVAAAQADLDAATGAADIGTKVVRAEEVEEGESAEVLAAETKVVEAEAEVEVLQSEVGKDPTVTQKRVTQAKLAAQKARSALAAAKKQAALTAPKVVAAKQRAQKAAEQAAEATAEAEAKAAEAQAKATKVVAQKKVEKARAEAKAEVETAKVATKRALAESKARAKAERAAIGPVTPEGEQRAREAVERHEKGREKVAKSLGQPARDLYEGEEKDDALPLRTQSKPTKPRPIVPAPAASPAPTPAATATRKQAMRQAGAARTMALSRIKGRLAKGEETVHIVEERTDGGVWRSVLRTPDKAQAEKVLTRSRITQPHPMTEEEQTARAEVLAGDEFDKYAAREVAWLTKGLYAMEAEMNALESKYEAEGKDPRTQEDYQTLLANAERVVEAKARFEGEARAATRREFVSAELAREMGQNAAKEYRLRSRTIKYDEAQADVDRAAAEAEFERATTDAAVAETQSGRAAKVLDIPPSARVSDPWTSVKGTPFHIPFNVWTALRTESRKIKNSLNRAIDWSRRLAQFSKLPFLRNEEGAGFDLEAEQFDAMVKLLEDTANFFEKKAAALESKHAEGKARERQTALPEGEQGPVVFSDPTINDEYLAYKQGAAEVRAFLNQPRGKVGMVTSNRDQGGVPAGMEDRVKVAEEGKRRGRRNRKGLAGLLKYSGRKGGHNRGKLNAVVQKQHAQVVVDHGFDANLIEPDYFYGEFEQLRDIVDFDADLVEVPREAIEEGTIGDAFPELTEMLRKQYEVQKWKRDPKAKAAMDAKVKKAVIDSLRERAESGRLRVTLTRRGNGWAVETVEGLDPRVVGLTQGAIDLFEDTANLDAPTSETRGRYARDLSPKTVGIYTSVVSDMKAWLAKGAGGRIEDADERAALAAVLDDPSAFESAERKRDKKMIDPEKAGKRKAKLVPKNIDETLPNRTYWFNISARGAAVFYNNMSKMLRDMETDFAEAQAAYDMERDTLGTPAPETKAALTDAAAKFRGALAAQQEMMTMMQAQEIGGIQFSVREGKEQAAWPGLGKSQREHAWTGEHMLANAYFGRGNYNSLFGFQVEFENNPGFGQDAFTGDNEDRFNRLMYSDLPFPDWAQAIGMSDEELEAALGRIYTLEEYNRTVARDDSVSVPTVYDAEVMALLAGVDRATGGAFDGLEHIRFFDGGSLGTHAMYSRNAKALFINLRTLGHWATGQGNTGDAAMAAHITHELGHHTDGPARDEGRDPANLNPPISLTGDWLVINDGIVVPTSEGSGFIAAEAIDLYNKQVIENIEDTPSQLFDYPLHPSVLQYLHERFVREYGEADAAAVLRDTVAAEVYAQAYTLYTAQPSWVRANMPDTYAYFESRKGGPNAEAPSAGRRRQAVRGDFRSLGATVRDEGRVARDRDGNPLVRGEGRTEPGVAEGREVQEPGNAGPVGPRLQAVVGQPVPPPLNIPDQSRVDRLRAYWQDKFLPIERAQEAVAGRLGTALPHSQDVRSAEQLMHGKLALDVKRLEESFIDKLHSLMQAGDISQADLNDYLYANHAAERNAVILRRDPRQPAGSGLTQAQIDAKWQALHAKYGQPGSPRFQQLADAAQVVYDNLAETRQKMLDAGLIDDQTLSAWEEGYEFYVPLKDIATDERSHRPVGSSIGGRESRFAVGRYSQASAPILGQTMEDMVTKLVRIRRNDVGNTLLRLVEGNPDPTLWRTADEDNLPTKRQYDARNGKVVEAPMSPLEMKMDGWFSTKVNGKTHYIWVEDDVLRRAINNMGEQEITLASKALVNTLGVVTRLMARLNTTYNPEFVFTNFIRDLEAGMVNLVGEADLKDSRTAQANITRGVLRDMRGALASMYRLERGTTNNSAMDQDAKEFQARGGMTGWTSMKNAEDYVNDLSFKFDSATLNNSPTAFVLGKTKSVLRFVEDVNGAVENGIRLAAYKNTRDTLIAEGVAPDVAKDKAAVLAKNLTINFNKRGEAGVVANSLYMFFNASVQGTAVMLRAAVGSKTVQRAMLGLSGFAFLLAMHNSAAGGEDDDGVPNYDKIPDYIKERNIILMKSDGTYLKLPLPYGYNIIHVVGTMMADYVNGTKTVAQVSKGIASSAIDAFMPVNFAESKDLGTTVVKAGVPTAFAPIIELAYNEDHFGSPIFKENLGVGSPKPDSSLSMRNTHPVARAMADWANKLTGGNENQPGLVDVSPDTLEYLVGYFTGGTGRFVSRTTKWATDDGQREGAVGAADTPFLRIFAGEKDKFVDSRRFFDADLEVEQAKAQFDFLKGEDKVEFRRMNRDLLMLEPAFKTARSRIKSLRQRQLLIANSHLSAEEKLLATDAIDDEVTAVYRRTASLYDKVKRPD